MLEKKTEFQKTLKEILTFKLFKTLLRINCENLKKIA